MRLVLKPLIDFPHIETHVISAYPPLNDSMASYEVLDNIHVHRISSLWKLPGKIRCLHKQYSFDVIHAHNARVALIAQLVSSCPMVLEFHSVQHERGWKATITHLMCRRSRRVFTLAKSASRHLSEQTQLPEQGIEVLYNGVQWDQFDPDRHDGASIRRRFGVTDSVTVGYAGTFWDWQGVDLLVSSFAAVVARHPCARLLLVGDKPDLDAIRRQVSSLGIQEQVIFTGHVPFEEMASYLACMDIFAVTRRKLILTDTAVPLKVLEAMGMRRCVLSTPVGGILEVIEHGTTGWITNDYHPASIAESISKLIDDPALRMRLGQAAREFVIGQFSWKSTAERMVRVYEAIALHGQARRSGA